MKMVYVNELTVIGTVSGERERERERQREREREGGRGIWAIYFFSANQYHMVYLLNIIEIKGK